MDYFDSTNRSLARHRRQLQLASLITLVAAVATSAFVVFRISSDDKINSILDFPVESKYIIFFSFLITVLSAGFMSYFYLASSRNQRHNRYEIHLQRVELHNLQKYLTKTVQELSDASGISTTKELRRILDELKDTGATSERTVSFSDEEQVKIRESATAALTSALAECVQEEVLSSFSKEGKIKSCHIELRDQFGRTIDRLGDEVAALTRRGNLNLVIGTMTTILAVVVLSYIVFTTKISPENLYISLPGLLMRVSLAVFIEIFSFFFLRLYKRSLDDIKYFQNEITNIELRLAAVGIALSSGDIKLMEQLANSLIINERNRPASGHRNAKKSSSPDEDDSGSRGVSPDEVLKLIRQLTDAS